MFSRKPKPEQVDTSQLGEQPQLSEWTHFVMALRLLRTIKQRIAHVRDSFDAKVRQLKAEADGDLSLPEAGCTLPEYQQRLTAAATDFVRNHKHQVFTDGKKTAAVDEATIKARKQAPKLDLLTEQEDIVKRLDESVQLTQKLQAVLNDHPSVALYLSVKISLDREGILRAYKAQQLTDEQLREQGLEVVTPPEKISIDV